MLQKIFRYKMDEADSQLPLTLLLARFNNLLHESKPHCDDWTYNYDISAIHCSPSNSNI